MGDNRTVFASARSILVINPNSNTQMTLALRPVVDALGFEGTRYTFFTAPDGPSSINNEDDAEESTRHALPALEPLLSKHDGFLVACFSAHPLVPALKKHAEAGGAGKPVTGIMEASTAAALQLTGVGKRWGVVTTGKVWEEVLTEGIGRFVGARPGNFVGVESTGLSAGELHDRSPEEVRRRMGEATARLLDRGGVEVVVLGCAGMAGLGEIVREVAGGRGERVRVVDGVQAGVGWVEGAVRAGW
ncbi:hypothetical protein EJ06DRAFT_496270, partial [Trichodelitschia bisporula]